MIANVVTLGLVLFVIFLLLTDLGDNAVFFIVVDALVFAAAIGFARCNEIVGLMDVSGTLDYALWSEFAGLFCGSVVICFCVLVSYFELGIELYDY